LPNILPNHPSTTLGVRTNRTPERTVRRYDRGVHATKQFGNFRRVADMRR